MRPVELAVDAKSCVLRARSFGFRPWVRRAGATILLVAAATTAAMTASLSVDPRARFGWMSERSVWLYLATLWLGGAKIFFGTFRAFAEVGDEVVVFRPLHQIGRRAIAWAAVRGTEQMIGGDRLIVYYDTPRGLRFVALNLNLVKGRRDLLALLDERLRSEGFVERIVGPSRYLSRVDSQTGAAAGDGS